MKRTIVVIIATAAAVGITASTAAAAWSSAALGTAHAASTTLNPPATVTTSVVDSTVTVTVTAGPATGAPPTGYRVDRAGTTVCTITGSTGSCNESNAPTGTSTYDVRSVRATWTSSAATSATATVVPRVTTVSSTTADGSYKAGAPIAVTVTFTAPVTVTGTPQLLLETGTTDRQAAYASGTGTSTLTFGYTVQAGDTSSDLDYQSTSALTLNGGTINDSGGHAATLTLPTPGATGSLGANKNIVIDTTAPTPTVAVGTIASNKQSGTVTGTRGSAAGDSATVTLGISCTKGNPQIGTASFTGNNFTASFSGTQNNSNCTVTVTQTDVAGNSGSGQVQFTL
jgi:hypothetical protein